MSAQQLPESLGEGLGRESAKSQASLRAVPQHAEKLSRMPFLVVLAAILAAGMVGLLLLNTSLQNQAFRASELKRHAAELSYTEGELQGQLAVASSSRELSRKASELGMRPNWAIGYVVLPDGHVIGQTIAADGNYLPSAVVRSDAELEQIHAQEATKRADDWRAAAQKAAENNKLKLEQAKAKADEDARKAQQSQQAVPGNPTPSKPASTQTARPNQPSAATPTKPVSNGGR